MYAGLSVELKNSLVRLAFMLPTACLDREGIANLQDNSLLGNFKESVAARVTSMSPRWAAIRQAVFSEKYPNGSRGAIRLRSGGVKH